MGTAVSLDPIAVSDPNGISAIDADPEVPLVDYPAVDTTTNFATAFIFDNASRALGASWEFTFTPQAADLVPGAGVGMENRRLLFEIGGSSNGSGFYLLDGIIHFAAKMNTTAPVEPTSTNDTDWADSLAVFFPLHRGPLAAGEPTTVAAIYDLDSLRYSVNGASEVNQALTGRTGQLNWTGDRSISIGADGPVGGPGGLSNVVGSTFRDNQYAPLNGPVSVARLYNVSGTSSDISYPGIIDEEVSATLTLAMPANGSLTATSGNGETYDGGSGVWTVTGTADTVNAALAAVQFVPNGTTGAMELIGVAVEDGDEDGSPPNTGVITLNQSLIQQWRLDFLGVTDPADTSQDLLDGNSNGVENLLELFYGFGDPTQPTGATDDLLVDGAGNITQHGGLTFVADPATGRAFMRYPRRVDFAEVGLDPTDQFSRNLMQWENAAGPPAVIGTGVSAEGVPIEAVEIELPLILPVSGGKARFGRVIVDIDPPQ